MSRNVRVSIFGRKSPYSVSVHQGHRKTVVDMKECLKKEIDIVLPEKPDLIVLPEACDRPVNLPGNERKGYYLERGTEILDFYREIAKNNNCNIAYSTIRDVPDGTFRNSTIIINRKGKIDGIYNKNHIVEGERTNGDIYCGTNAPIIDCDFGKVGCAICFDLNFEPIRLEYEKQRPEMIIFCSNYHGGIMQNYWAYSCRSYFVSAFGYGESTIVSPVGETVGRSSSYYSYFTKTINLYYAVAHLDYNGERLRAMKAKYGPGVTIHDPSYLGAVLISSEIDGVSAMDMVGEFEVELLDDYFTRSLEFHDNNRAEDFADECY
ncbi:MAG: carbon-nitrogen hydrolase family protein [Clostridiales bacterium]|nr:carbon-nitrogen hydrolase family protein [Clostridiales bacterium]